MAIFYEHIKGCGAGSTGTDTNKDRWTWIEWPKAQQPNDKLYVYTSTSNVKSSTPVGYIILSNAEGTQSIGSEMQFLNNIFGKNEGTDSNITNLQLAGKITINTVNTKNPGKLVVGDTELNEDGLTTKKHITLTDDGILSTEKGDIKSTDGNITTTSGNITTTNGKCEALYFNATSDRRAKSNITLAQFSALSVINKLPIYTFNYLNDPKLSVGLIAQEAAEYDLDGFNMVDNLDAPGEFGDFMQMKESKLVYVLWKAVQELSDQVETLKAEIHNLKNTK